MIKMWYILGLAILFVVLYATIYVVLISVVGVVAIQLFKFLLAIGISLALLWLGYKIGNLIVNHLKK